MRIVIVTPFSINCRNGVGLATMIHAKILKAMSYEVFIISSDMSAMDKNSLNISSFFVRSTGSGAMYSPGFTDIKELRRLLDYVNPDLIVVEGWQTALGSATINMGSDLGYKIIVISHGSSLFPFTKSITGSLRALAWIPYRYINLPKLISKVSTITTLDEVSNSDRFYDRNLAIAMGKRVVKLVNAPVNFDNKYRERDERRNQVCIIGYYSSVKNQMLALKIIKKFPIKGIVFKFIGRKTGLYYKRCRYFAKRTSLDASVRFLDDDECNISEEISSSIAILNTSITEALPLTILEAMASGTPFLARPVGAIINLSGGLIADSEDDFILGLQKIIHERSYWTKLSQDGKFMYKSSFTIEHVEKQLIGALNIDFA